MIHVVDRSRFSPPMFVIRIKTNFVWKTTIFAIRILLCLQSFDYFFPIHTIIYSNYIYDYVRFKMEFIGIKNICMYVLIRTSIAKIRNIFVCLSSIYIYREFVDFNNFIPFSFFNGNDSIKIVMGLAAIWAVSAACWEFSHIVNKN